jgi:AraC-like DNA-binding protein
MIRTSSRPSRRRASAGSEFDLHTQRLHVVMIAVDTASVRRDWIGTVVGTLQLTTGVIALAEPLGARDTVLASVSSLPDPQSALERQVLRGLLLEFAIRSSVTLHCRSCAAIEACTFSPLPSMSRLADAPDPLAGAVQWIDAFWIDLRCHHQPALSVRVAELLRKEPARRWRMNDLARHFGVSPKAIRADFQRVFQRTAKEYQTLLRIADALRRVNDEKVDGLATSLGYKSKKDFYVSFKRCTGMTPRQYRRINTAAASRIRRSLENQLKR